MEVFMALFDVLKKKGVALRQKLYQARLTLAIRVYAALLFMGSGLGNAFAAETGGTIKATGTKLFEALRGYALIISGIGFSILVILALVLVTFGGVNKQWKTKGMEFIKWGLIGVVGLATVSLIIPSLFEFINSLGGDQISSPIAPK